MRKQCVPGASPFFTRAGDEAKSVCGSSYHTRFVNHANDLLWERDNSLVHDVFVVFLLAYVFQYAR